MLCNSGVLNEDDIERVMSKPTGCDQALEVMQMMLKQCKRGRRPYTAFLQVLIT